MPLTITSTRLRRCLLWCVLRRGVHICTLWDERGEYHARQLLAVPRIAVGAIVGYGNLGYVLAGDGFEASTQPCNAVQNRQGCLPTSNLHLTHADKSIFEHVLL